MILLILLASITFAVAIILGLIVLRNGPGSTLHRLFFLLTLSVALWSISSLYSFHTESLRTMKMLFRISVGFAGLNAAFMLHFTLRLTDLLRRELRKYEWLLYLPMLTISILIMGNSSYFEEFQREGDFWNYAHQYSSTAFASFFGYWLVFQVVSLLLIYFRVRRAESREVRRHCRILFWALFASITLTLAKALILPLLIDLPTKGGALSFQLIWLIAVTLLMDRDHFLLGPRNADKEAFREIPGLATVTTDTNGKILTLNREAEELLDGSQKRLIGAHFNEFMSNSSSSLNFFGETRGRERESFSQSIELRSNGEKKIPVEARVTSLHDKWSIRIGYLLLLREKMPEDRLRSRYKLSRREAEVLLLLIKGTTNAEIAETLFIAERTVKTHVTHIFQKLGVKNRIQAISVLRDNGLFALET
jgi:PAS domain S-box-containing protein